MDMVVLAASNNFLIKGIAWVLTFIIDAVFYVVQMITVPQSMALTIILFTLITRALMMPLNLKQQRSSRKMQRLQPKIKEIQDKYKGKTDPESQQHMQLEMNAIYKENKTSPFSGCLPLLIQMPILFALYEILRNVPFYVSDMNEVFTEMATMVQSIEGYASIITENFAEVTKSIQKFDANTMDGVIDFLYHMSRDQWSSFMEMTALGENARFVELYQLQESINTVGYGILTFNLAEAPGWKGIGIIIPILTGGLTWLQTFLSQRASKKRAKLTNSGKNTEDPTQQSMKMMQIISPLMIGFFAISLPMGLGLYWMFSSVFGILFQFICDKMIDREEYKEVLRKKAAYEEKQLMAQSIRSNIGKETGNRFGTGTAGAAAKSKMAGNRIAAIQKENEAREKASSESSKEDEE